MLNMFVMQGTIVGLNGFTSQKGTAILEFGLKSTDDFGNEVVVTCKAFGLTAKSIEEGIKKGSAVTVQGTIGVYQDSIQLQVREVHVKGQVLRGWGKSTKDQLKDQAPTKQEGQQGEKKTETGADKPSTGIKI